MLRVLEEYCLCGPWHRWHLQCVEHMSGGGAHLAFMPLLMAFANKADKWDRFKPDVAVALHRAVSSFVRGYESMGTQQESARNPHALQNADGVMASAAVKALFAEDCVYVDSLAATLCAAPHCEPLECLMAYLCFSRLHVSRFATSAVLHKIADADAEPLATGLAGAGALPGCLDALRVLQQVGDSAKNQRARASWALTGMSPDATCDSNRATGMLEYLSTQPTERSLQVLQWAVGVTSLPACAVFGQTLSRALRDNRPWRDAWVACCDEMAAQLPADGAGGDSVGAFLERARTFADDLD